jgi:transposase InsO family protein
VSRRRARPSPGSAIPAFFNTDQGTQFTSDEFPKVLRDHGIEISMDGRGRCNDNIFVERLWWTVKYEWVYLRPAATGIEQKHSLGEFSTGIMCDGRIRHSAGEHRTRLTLPNRRARRHRPPDAMPRRCREFVDSRLRRSPPDRASAVPYGQAGENAMRFPHLADSSAAVTSFTAPGNKTG